MRRCEVCGKQEVLPYKCNYCNRIFCSEHRLPEKHSCDGLYDIPVKVKKEIVDRRKEAGKEVLKEYYDPILRRQRNPLKLYGYNNVILALITIVFALSIIYKPMFSFFALHPYKVETMPWQLITSIFLHGSFDHYLVNAIVLLFFGSELERRVGGDGYLKIFFLSGIAGNLMYLVFSFLSGSPTPAVGASGAIYGIMGTLAVIAPEIRVLLFFFIPLSIRVAVLLFAIYDLLMTPFSIFTGVAHVAHLGGLAVGLYFGRKLRVWRRFY